MLCRNDSDLIRKRNYKPQAQYIVTSKCENTAMWKYWQMEYWNPGRWNIEIPEDGILKYWQMECWNTGRWNVEILADGMLKYWQVECWNPGRWNIETPNRWNVEILADGILKYWQMETSKVYNIICVFNTVRSTQILNLQHLKNPEVFALLLF